MQKTKDSAVKEVKAQISQKDLVRAYVRLHKFLSSRAKQLKSESRKSKNKDKKKLKQYSNSAVELYAFVRLMELCQNLTKDVEELEQIIDIIGKSTTSESGKLN